MVATLVTLLMPLLAASFGAHQSPHEFKSDWGGWPTQFSQDTHFFLFPSVLPTSQLLLVVNTKHLLVVSVKLSKPFFFFFYYYIFRRKFQTATPPRQPVNFDGSKVKTSSSNGNEGLFGVEIDGEVVNKLFSCLLNLFSVHKYQSDLSFSRSKVLEQRRP